MSREALRKLAVIQAAVEERYTVVEASLKLNLSVRRVKQLKKAFREQGECAFIHGNSGRHPANYRDETLRKHIVSLKKSEKYQGTNFSHFKDLLEKEENIRISYSALSCLLKDAGIESKRKHREGGRRFKSRERRSAFGELLQADASPYDWFGSGTRYNLHGFIDDATGKITGLYFCLNECLLGYLEVLRQTLTNYGVPEALYADKAGIFFVNNKKVENWTVAETLAGTTLDKTQFASIAEERLGITMIRAHTPQAKGRVERMWNTLQDRLVECFKMDGITDPDTANRVLEKYIAEFNDRFAVEPASSHSAFVPLGDDDDLDTLLAVRHERTTDNCGCFSFQNFIFQVESEKPLVKKKIIFLFSEKIGFMALHDKKYYNVSALGLKQNRKITHIPEVTKILMEKNYYADGRIQAA